MASGRDVRDMLGLPAGADVPKAAVQKRPKPAGGSRKIQGVAREVAALYGERPPPVAVYEEKKAYRAKRQSTGPAKKWIPQPFTNPARADGLVLKHWRRKPTAAPAVQEGEDAAMQDNENADTYLESCADYVKYDIKVDMPTFTDEEYDAHLRSDDWSREETDYLFQVVRDYSYRWAVIWDRYEYEPSKHRQITHDNATGDQEQALSTLPFAPSKQRSVEDLKARFYQISAKLMKLRIPEVQMDADQYATYEMLTKFDPIMERNRKMLATALMNRVLDEVKEEEFLLTELQRINMAANRLDAEREELRSRLDAPPQNQSVSAGLQAFTSSQALQALFQQLFQQDRSKKRASGGGTGPGRLSLSANDMVHTPGSAQQQLSAANRRQSMAQPPTAQTPVKQLSPHQEHRFNVSTHDRLTSGVTFGSDKLLKMRQAKSNVQTQKIGTMLASLGVAEVISIPTSKVGEVFENLISKVSKLLDVRKVREKEEGECRVLLAMKERRANGGSASVEPRPKQEVPDSQETPDVDADGENEDEDDAEGDAEEDDNDNDNDKNEEDEDDAEGEEDEDRGGFNGEDDADEDADVDAEGEDESSKQQSRATSIGAGHKRSASVFSQGSQQSSKRLRK
ncbi:swr complex subunit [Neocucurbitaria cava]|uniref:SWR1-complex protein 4 n=1 Tax=Neocucurbitaria cava TaxID=798079 RepID=A0A9W8Y2C6_9PLEO|nr:swr complex subunit [Neocucurbitaria cava]